MRHSINKARPHISREVFSAQFLRRLDGKPQRRASARCVDSVLGTTVADYCNAYRYARHEVGALLWDFHRSMDRETYWTDWLNNKPWTTLFIDGNHENFDRLQYLPKEKRFGGTVGVLRKNILHLLRGEVYEIDGKNIFTFGGAYSIDKNCRTEHISWWEQEEPTTEEMGNGLRNLRKHGWSVDYVLTHECPTDIRTAELSKLMNIYERDEYYPLSDYLNTIKDTVDFRRWYFGHYHIDYNLTNKFICLYRSIDRLLY